MGLFKSEEEKQQKKEEKLQAMLKKYYLEDLDSKYLKSVRDIHSELVGMGLLEFGFTLSPDEKSAAKLQVHFLNTIVQQNWILIRELDELNKKLDNQNKKEQ